MIHTYTLQDDRIIEYGWVNANLPQGTGWLLDVGTPQGYPTPQVAAGKGYRVVAVDLMTRNATGGNVEYRRGDLLTMGFERRFDWVLNISSVEHFGLAGRYSVAENDTDADLKAMARIRLLMKPEAKMLLTIPVGIDAVIHPLHRIYGIVRLPILLSGYAVSKEAFYGKKNGVDKYVVVDKVEAMTTPPRCANPHSESAVDHYYAIGCFVLEIVP